MQKPIIVALDFPNATSAMQMAEQLDPNLCRVKIGKQLFTSTGPSIVEELRKKGFDVFLDLKFHDIPNTVAEACAVAADLGVWMVNIHASGGTKMMEAAANKLSQYTSAPLLIGVTVLTSMEDTDLSEINVPLPVESQVVQLADLAKNCGLGGVVASAQEASLLRKTCGSDFTLVTPGIRFSEGHANDQKRIMTPADAVQAGSNYLVMGRPITQADDPIKALERANSEFLK